MKCFHVAALVFAVLALAATASAQSSTSQFVVGGETAKKIHDFGTINLATAERIAEKCEDLARKEGVAVSIYILDNEGNHVYIRIPNCSRSKSDSSPIRAGFQSLSTIN